MGKIIGIDLGTSNCLAAIWNNGLSRLIPNDVREYQTPSVVSFDEDGTIYVGKEAEERLVSHPESTVRDFKRFLGTDKKYSVFDKTYCPEELTAILLRRIKEDAEKYLKEPVEEAIISVSACMDDAARLAVKRAGALAGLKVEQLMNEASAAALACQSTNRDRNVTIMVLDLGGGTLEVTLAECFGKMVEIMAVGGDRKLGGQDMDEALAKYFLQSHGLEEDKLTPETKALLLKSAETCRRALTEEMTAEMTVQCDQINGQLTVTREKLKEIFAELFERMGAHVEAVLQSGRTRKDMVDYLIMVGGCCNMPVVQQTAKCILERSDVDAMNADYMVALGMGVAAGMKEENREVKNLVFTDINPYALGVSVKNGVCQGKSALPEDGISFVIPQNSPIPCSIEKSYANASDDQTELLLEIYKSKTADAQDVVLVKKIPVAIPKGPVGTVQCQVRYAYDINGILEVDLHIPMTGEKRRLIPEKTEKECS